MAWQAIVMYLIVAGVGIPAAFRNVTALMMVIAWLSVELVYQLTGDSLPLKYSFMADIAVVAVIYAKSIKRCGPKVYPLFADQLRCLITDLTPWDRGIVAIFLLGAWPIYVLTFDSWWKWMLLWGLCIAQFLLAGGEALASFLAARREKEKSTPIIDRHMVVIPFPVRVADAVKPAPNLGDMLIAKARGHG